MLLSLLYLLEFVAWFLVWLPVVALLEYATHRWIMHTANRLLDPQRTQLKAHGKHHQGDNDLAFVDMPIRNGLMLTSPFLAVVIVIGFALGSLSSVAIPLAALLSWSFVYTYLWNCMHRAIHQLERNWFARCGPLFGFFQAHHLKHHQFAATNYGTVFPWTDYVFFTWCRRNTVSPSEKTTLHTHQTVEHVGQ